MDEIVHLRIKKEYAEENVEFQMPSSLPCLAACVPWGKGTVVMSSLRLSDWAADPLALYVLARLLEAKSGGQRNGGPPTSNDQKGGHHK